MTAAYQLLPFGSMTATYGVIVLSTPGAEVCEHSSSSGKNGATPRFWVMSEVSPWL